MIPPAGMAGGWPCFFVSLGMIGLLTAIVGDLANIFGCLVGLKPSVTGKIKVLFCVKNYLLKYYKIIYVKDQIFDCI